MNNPLTLTNIANPSYQPYKKMISNEISRLILSKQFKLVLIIGKRSTGKSAAYREALSILANRGASEGRLISIQNGIECNHPHNLLTQLDASSLGLVAAIREALKLSSRIIGIDELPPSDECVLNLACDASMTGYLVIATIHCSEYDQIDASLRSLNPLVLKAHVTNGMGSRQFHLDINDLS